MMAMVPWKNGQSRGFQFLYWTHSLATASRFLTSVGRESARK